MSLIKANFTKEEILQSGVWYGTTTLFAKGVALINTLVIIYFLTLYEYGVFKLLLSLLGLFQVLVLSGLDGVVRNEIAQYIRDNNQNKAAKLLFEFFFAKGVLVLFIWILFLLSIQFYFSKIYDSNFTNILWFAGLFILFNFISNFFSIFYKSIGALELLVKINGVMEPIKLGLILFMFLVFSPSILSVVFSILVAQLVSHIFYIFFARHDLLSWWRKRYSGENLIWNLTRGYGRWSLGTNILSSTLSNGRNYLIKFLISTEAVAIWSMALTILGAMTSVLPSDKILATFLPFKIKLKDLKVAYYKQYVKYLTFIYIGIFISSWVGAYILIEFLFPAYKLSLPIFLIMSLTLIFSGIYEFVMSYLHTLRYQKIIFLRALQRTFMTVVFMIIFVKAFGYVGLAFEYIVTTTYLAMFSYRSLVKLHPELRLELSDLYFKTEDYAYIKERIPLFWNSIRGR